jgi:signal transduction histidine kinase
MRIRSHLLLLAAVVLTPGFLAAALAIGKVREGERQAALRGLHETVRATAQLVDGQVGQSLGALTALAGSPSLHADDLEAFRAEAARIDRRPHVWTLLLDDTGTQRINTTVPFGTPPPVASAAALERVSTVLSTQRPLVSDVNTGPVSGKLLTTLYVPAPPTASGRRYVIGQAFSLDHWKQTAPQPQGRADWVVAVLDRNGKFVSRSHSADALVGQPARPELAAAAAASPEGLNRHAKLEGMQAYDAFAHSELTGWTIAVAAPVDAIEASATQAVGWLLFGLAVAMSAALLAASWLNRTLLQAIQRASAAAQALGKGQPPVPLRTSLYEVNALGDALGEAGRLLTAEQAARAGVEAQRERLLDNERLARADAQRENAAKDEFIALLGHELRNPLAAISGATEVLVRVGSDPDKAGRFVAIIQRQNRHLKQIVDDLLEVSRLLSGKIALDARPIDLAACVRRCVEALRTTEAAAGHRLDIETQEVWVVGDPVRIEQIVNNLVSNALKFSPTGSRVQVRVAADGTHSTIEVIDAGSGITAELMPRIFEPFVQGPDLRGREASGLGIGLALVRQLVELHGGTVAARSDGPGTGSAFVVSLPCAPGTRERDDVVAATLAHGQGCRVMLVEDNADARVATAQMLRLLGHEVLEAEDGAAALRRLAELAPPDVVVLDLGMPDIDGYQLAARIRATPALRGIPLIALSGYGQERDLRASSDAGFDAHLVKPVRPEALADAIELQRARRQAPVEEGATDRA